MHLQPAALPANASTPPLAGGTATGAGAVAGDGGSGGDGGAGGIAVGPGAVAGDGEPPPACSACCTQPCPGVTDDLLRASEPTRSLQCPLLSGGAGGAGGAGGNATGPGAVGGQGGAGGAGGAGGSAFSGARRGRALRAARVGGVGGGRCCWAVVASCLLSCCTTCCPAPVALQAASCVRSELRRLERPSGWPAKARPHPLQRRRRALENCTICNPPPAPCSPSPPETYPPTS